MSRQANNAEMHLWSPNTVPARMKRKGQAAGQQSPPSKSFLDSSLPTTLQPHHECFPHTGFATGKHQKPVHICKSFLQETHYTAVLAMNEGI